MRLLFLSVCSILAFGIVRGQEKGMTPVVPNGVKETGVTRAVIVGISDYQNVKITDLQFADRDALAFANYLKSEAGGKVDSSHITLLLNEKATAGQFVSALYGLMEESKEGDLVIIYFSGHGDVESTTISQPGFLLCWDAPARVYMGGGTFGLSYLQEVISTLALATKAKVLVITDACRAGKLAGSSIGGSQATAANLSKQYANEVKIMSCQPDELSLEGKSWGGGRGVFSYYFLAGVQGLADKNNDGAVNLAEIERYLGDKVPTAVAPHSQIPMTIGNKNTVLSKVDPKILEELKKLDVDGGFYESGNRSLGINWILSEDTILLKKVELFNAALSSGHLDFPLKNSAWSIFQEIKDREELNKNIGLMKRNLAAALQDGAQQAINDYLMADPKELKSRWGFDPKYDRYPEQLEKSAELLGDKHFFYNTLISRMHYFKGLNLRLKGQRENLDTFYLMALEEQQKALKLEPKSAHILNEIGYINFLKEDYKESVLKYKEALQYAPSWPLLWSNLCGSYNWMGDYENGLISGEKAVELDSMFVLGIYNLGHNYQYTGNLSKANEFYLRAIDIDSSFSDAYFRLGSNYVYDKKYDLAVKMKKLGLIFEPNNVPELNALGYTLLQLNELEEAKTYYEKGRSILPVSEYTFQGMIEYYMYTNDIVNAENELTNYVIKFPKDNFAHYLLASIYAQTGRNVLCCESLEKAFKAGFKDLDSILTDDNFKKVIQMKEFKILKNQYFSK
ncbi:MAG: caspase family protein [Saprospiraceae bacterium]|nr:caspase family protein [Candidatus Vicinibacter affinis]